MKRVVTLPPTRARCAPLWPMTDHSAAFVYLYRRESDGLIKIGCTTDPRNRERLLRVKHVGRIFALCPGWVTREQMFHWLFADARVEAEWFEPVPLLLKCAREMRSTGDTSIVPFDNPVMGRRSDVLDEIERHGVNLAGMAEITGHAPELFKRRALSVRASWGLLASRMIVVHFRELLDLPWFAPPRHEVVYCRHILRPDVFGPAPETEAVA